MRATVVLITFISMLLCSCKNEKSRRETIAHQNTEIIFPKGEPITNNNFVGNEWLQQMIMPHSLNPTQVGSVTFEPGARTNWHVHPGGQILLITGGTGYYQEKAV